ncbi:LpqB family beta-propeller domain-containing protein [Isoptericola sp. 4D.3]|uniref:LpqB family beta-propeller domain-containing protein n=1 Tax=Isoptericola peretonis TaxID=2918523 RepID=A0ABT0J6C4_9MICO|nr:LpqB family beta-propeller domain-containing protein [Isoptericola sp. 4D.3]
MTRGPRRRPAAALLAAALVLVATVACARIPTDGAVRDGDTELENVSEIGYIPTGPAAGASPDQIVQGFLGVAQLGPTSTSAFTVAQEFLTPEAWEGWDRYARVLVLEEDPQVELEDIPADATEATVTATVRVVATLDERGMYTEAPKPSEQVVPFRLTREAGGEWRVAQLEDGLMLPTAFFGQAFHPTTLYFPTPDLTWWVPDLRWFPRQTWRTDATSEILAGPPDWLEDSTTTVIPEGTSLAIDAVTVTDDGTIDVSLTTTIAQASAEKRSLAVAQLQATLAEGEGRTVVLSDGNTPLTTAGTDALSVPRTSGDALAVTGGRVVRVQGGELAEPDVPLPLAGLDPTALATGPGDEPVVVRDGQERVVRVSGEGAPAVLISGTRLVPPSVDRFDGVWSAQGSQLFVALASGDVISLDVDWLSSRTIRSVRVSPEGARIAVVSSGPSGRLVHVAGVVRDAENVPTGLSAPVQVGASVRQVTQAVWQDQTVLALLGNEADGDGAVFLAGVGGLAGQGGLSRTVAGVTDPRWVTASVGTGAMLAVDGGATLYSRQSSALWSMVSEDVDLVAYPG